MNLIKKIDGRDEKINVDRQNKQLRERAKDVMAQMTRGLCDRKLVRKRKVGQKERS